MLANYCLECQVGETHAQYKNCEKTLVCSIDLYCMYLMMSSAFGELFQQPTHKSCPSCLVTAKRKKLTVSHEPASDQVRLHDGIYFHTFLPLGIPKRYTELKMGR